MGKYIPNLRGLKNLPKMDVPTDKLEDHAKALKLGHQSLIGTIETAAKIALQRQKLAKSNGPKKIWQDGKQIILDGDVSDLDRNDYVPRKNDSQDTPLAIARSRQFPKRASAKRHIDARHPAEFDI